MQFHSILHVLKEYNNVYIHIYLERGGKKCENRQYIHTFEGTRVTERVLSEPFTTIDKFLIQTLIAHQFLNPIRCNLLQLYLSPPPPSPDRGLDGTGWERQTAFDDSFENCVQRRTTLGDSRLHGINFIPCAGINSGDGYIYI